MTGTRSNTIRTPAEVALAMRYTAGHVERARGLDPQALATLLVTWADIIDGAIRDPLPEVVADRLPLATELDSSADMIAAECVVAGGRLAIPADDTPAFIAWLRECARQAGELQMRASGFRFDPGNADAAAPHPDDVVIPGIETGEGAHVTYRLMERLRAQRQQRIDTRPCDTEDRR